MLPRVDNCSCQFWNGMESNIPDFEACKCWEQQMWGKKKTNNVLTLCIPFCFHWWPPCLSRWASGPPGTSEEENHDLNERTVTPNTMLHYFTAMKMWILTGSKWLIEDWAPVQSCLRQYKTSGPTRWDHSQESTWESCSIHCPAGIKCTAERHKD